MGSMFCIEKKENNKKQQQEKKSESQQQQQEQPKQVSSSATANSSSANTGNINSYDRCMLQLKLQRDKLTAASRQYDRLAVKEKDLAKQFLLEGKREKALYCLKRKKAQEVHLDRVQKYLDNIMTMMQNVESKQLDNEVAMALKQGADELKALNEHLSLDDIQSIMDSAAEQIQITDEASALLAQNLVSLDEDDDAILAELDAITASEGVGTSKLESVPKSKKIEGGTVDSSEKADKQQQQMVADLVVPNGSIEGTATTVANEEDKTKDVEAEEDNTLKREAVCA